MESEGPYRKILSVDIGVRNLGLSVVECRFTPPYNQWSQLTILQLELVDVVDECQRGKKVRAGSRPKNAKTLNIHVVCQALVRLLWERRAWLEGVTDIRVEQQPLLRGRSTGSVGSSRMKVVQHCILTFFETYYWLQPQVVKPSIQPSSPANKLKCQIDVENFALAPLEQTDKNTDYKQRKARAVEGFERMIQACNLDPRHKVLYDDKKKHDDLADCVLQAVFELQTQACRLRHPPQRKKRQRE